MTFRIQTMNYNSIWNTFMISLKADYFILFYRSFHFITEWGALKGQSKLDEVIQIGNKIRQLKGLSGFCTQR